jgi:hypothetical protein
MSRYAGFDSWANAALGGSPRRISEKAITEMRETLLELIIPPSLRNILNFDCGETYITVAIAGCFRKTAKYDESASLNLKKVLNLFRGAFI